MQHWSELVRSVPGFAAALALLFFGSWMLERPDVFPEDLQYLSRYAAALMMFGGGAGMLGIMPHAIYRQYRGS